MVDRAHAPRSGGLALVLLSLLSLLLASPPGARGGEDPAGDGGAQAPAAPQDPLAQAQALLAAGEPTQAAQVLQEALEAQPDPKARWELEAALGRALVSAGEPYAALQHLESVASARGLSEDHVTLAEALLAVARTHLAGGSAGSLDVTPYLLDALQAAGRVTETEGPPRARRLVVEGEARFWMGDHEAAAAALAQVPAGTLPAPEAARAAELLAQAFYGLGRYEEAAAAFASAGRPLGEAAAWAAAKRPAETAAAYGRLLAAGPFDADLVRQAVQAARYAGGAGDMLAALYRVEASGADAAILLTARAELLDLTGDLDGALALLVQAAELDPTSARPLVEQGRLLFARSPEDLEAAVAAWIEALGRSPEDADATGALWDLAGRDYAAAWRSPRSLARSLLAQRALAEARPEDGLAWANYGNTLRLAGQAAEALAAYDRAVAAEPEDPGIRSDRGLALAALGRADEALAVFLEAAELDASFDAARQNAARVLWLRGDDVGSSALLAQALASTRSAGSGAMRYRFLLDRAWRTARRGTWR